MAIGWAVQVPASGRRGGADGKLPMHTLEFDGELVSSNCGVNLHINTTSIQLQAYYDKAINYTLMVTCLSVVQVRRVLIRRFLHLLEAANEFPCYRSNDYAPEFEWTSHGSAVSECTARSIQTTF